MLNVEWLPFYINGQVYYVPVWVSLRVCSVRIGESRHYAEI